MEATLSGDGHGQSWDAGVRPRFKRRLRKRVPAHMRPLRNATTNPRAIPVRRGLDAPARGTRGDHPSRSRIFADEQTQSCGDLAELFTGEDGVRSGSAGEPSAPSAIPIMAPGDGDAHGPRAQGRPHQRAQLVVIGAVRLRGEEDLPRGLAAGRAPYPPPTPGPRRGLENEPPLRSTGCRWRFASVNTP